LFTEPIDPLDPASKKLPRSTAVQVYAQIEKDLTEAATDLPARAVTVSENMLGRLTKGSAYALLAKASLYQKKYAEAIAAANKVIALGEYNLTADYYENFRQNKPNTIESLCEVQHNDNAVVDNGGGWGADAFDGSTSAIKMQACEGGWGQNRPTTDLYNSFESSDIRRKYVAATDADVIDGVTMCGTPASPSIAKFIILGKGPGGVGPRDDVSPINRVLVRYADVLLIKAEALAASAAPASAAPSEAITELLKVRNRVGLTSPNATQLGTYTAEQLLRFIRDERRKELGMEGWRLFDLRRWGADSARNALIRVGKINTTDRIWDNKYLLYPIPQSEIDLSGGAVQQTPGYN
jgi:starch-binding outer membrane protein, SusD/RagB family